MHSNAELMRPGDDLLASSHASKLTLISINFTTVARQRPKTGNTNTTRTADGM